MNPKSKFLGDSAWKDLASKNKIKDNGLAKALERLERAGDDDHDEQSRSLQEAIKLAAQLKKDKAVAAAAPVARYLAEVQSDAEALLREVAKARAEHEKAQKAKAEAEKKAAAKKQDDDDDDEEEESPELLTSKLKPLLKLVAKGESMHALLAKSGKQVVVMLSRKPIPPARRKMLADQLGGGSTKYYPGTCSLEAGATTFALKAEVAGMSKLVKAALLQQTGLRLNKIKCRGEDGDDEDDDGTPDEAPEAAAKPDAALNEAPVVWRDTSALIAKRIGLLKDAVRKHYGSAGAALLADIDKNLLKLDAITDRLDDKLADALAELNRAEPPTRAAALARARQMAADYSRYIQDEPLIDHIDGNPFGVPTQLQTLITGKLKQLDQAMAA